MLANKTCIPAYLLWYFSSCIEVAAHTTTHHAKDMLCKAKLYQLAHPSPRPSRRPQSQQKKSSTPSAPNSMHAYLF